MGGLGSDRYSSFAVIVPYLTVAALKRRRRARRLLIGPPERRIAASWDEMIDRYSELGLEVPKRSTRLQVSQAIESQATEQCLMVPTGGFVSLANIVDTAVFSSQVVTDGTVEQAWRQTDAATKASLDSAGWLRRRIASFRYRRQTQADAGSAMARPRRSSRAST